MPHKKCAACLIIAMSGFTSSAAADDLRSTEDGQSRQRWAEVCKNWDDWDKPGPAFRVHANTYYVGTCGIGAVLIAGRDGHVLIDGGTEDGAPLIAANIAALGFDLSDVRILLHSHEHFDHVAGLAALQRLSGGRLYASEAAAPVLASGIGAPSDPQYGLHEPFPAARVDKILTDGETVRLGDITLTAVATPGHSEGALSWQWKSCEAGRCETIVYADSLSPVSRDGYRFSDHPAYLEAYRRGLGKLAQLECTFLLTPHPSASGMRERLLDGRLSDSRACADYAAAISKRLEARLQKESAED